MGAVREVSPGEKIVIALNAEKDGTVAPTKLGNDIFFDLRKSLVDLAKNGDAQRAAVVYTRMVNLVRNGTISYDHLSDSKGQGMLSPSYVLFDEAKTALEKRGIKDLPDYPHEKG